MRTIIFTCLSLLLILFFSFRTVNTHPVTGTVKDETGKMLPGVSIVEKGTTTATTSDVFGAFSITVSSKNATLVFSYVGYEAKEEKVKERNVVHITLSASKTELQEVVVVGYASGYNEFSKQLSGRVPGVQVHGN